MTQPQQTTSTQHIYHDLDPVLGLHKHNQSIPIRYCIPINVRALDAVDSARNKCTLYVPIYARSASHSMLRCINGGFRIFVPSFRRASCRCRCFQARVSVIIDPHPYTQIYSNAQRDTRTHIIYILCRVFCVDSPDNAKKRTKTKIITMLYVYGARAVCCVCFVRFSLGSRTVHNNGHVLCRFSARTCTHTHIQIHVHTRRAAQQHTPYVFLCADRG